MPAPLQLTTQLLDPSRAARLAQLAPALHRQLPADYLAFLTDYGPGTYAGEVEITYPDPATIRDTFGELADLWELDERFTAADLQAAVQLGYSANGDSIYLAPRWPGRVFVLPRHAEVVREYDSWQAAVAALLPPLADVYFDPAYEAEVAQLSLARDGRLLPIGPVWEAFRGQYRPAVVLRAATQPRCLLPALGGWVAFDLVYKSSITVKYQRAFAAEAAGVLAFLRRQLPPG